MYPLSTASAASFLFTLLLFFHLTASFPLNDTSNLPNCNQIFSSGAVTNITYPFTGGQHPSYCDPLVFHPGCSNYITTTLTANSLPYLVTQVNQTSQTLRLSLLGLYSGGRCIDPFNMTTFDNSSFSLVSNHETLSLFYGCENLGDSVMANFKFSCPWPGYSEEGFFMIGDHGPSFMDKCETRFQVPFLRNRAEELKAKGSSLLVEVLKEGFDVSYSNPYSVDCQKYYKHSGGQCELDGAPICICDDQLCPETGSSWFGGGRKIAIATLGAVAAIIAFSIIAICFTRREGSFIGIIAMTFKLKSSQNVDRFETFMMDYHDRPSMTKVLEMFERSLHSLQIPPKPLLSSPKRSAQDHSTTISSLPWVE
ncbi:hypothetical protein SADUNF_Sadunf04G0068700 [Salix dunnii]|uniref:non-specific serine/threonine protein kinase n=1 Tax=Salix dunnii TaxID=1413687 RepID=A0A835K797_9ROSI|nr:hypothetical protein SADUNF_Sadunf04G0068700 [Salix dunnii]